MRLSLCLLFALAFACVAPAAARVNGRLMSVSEFLGTPADSTTSCLGCTLILGIANQRALQTNSTPKAVLDAFCAASTNPIAKPICQIADDLLTLLGLDRVDPAVAPEVTCQQATLCPTPLQCQLFQQWPPQSGRKVEIERQPLPHHGMAVSIPSGGGDFWSDFSNALQILLTGAGASANVKQLFDNHMPMSADDADGDLHAVTTALRGADWRGRDCDDTHADIYPGRDESNYPPSVDHNCNGINGTFANGSAYEDIFCAPYQRFGIAVFGDSAAAHFRIPPFLLTPSQFFNDSMWDGVLHMLLNEADWPECSGWTGFESVENCPINYLPGATNVTSIYAYLRQRNLCNHRDYASIAVNGARTGSMGPVNSTIYSYKRDQQNDAPVLAFYALIGNDVCSGHPDFDHMTTPAEFQQNVLDALTYLDTQLPKGSHVVFIPLATGTLLHEILANRTHPIGVTYSDLYDYLICYGKAPCWGWMSSNATVRNLTQQRADELSAVYTTVIEQFSSNFTHFDMAVVPGNMMSIAVQKWIQEGRDPAELIEPVDGFHPAQTANALTSQELWAWLQTNYPDFLGAQNPFNPEIIKIFGDQGGH